MRCLWITVLVAGACGRLGYGPEDVAAQEQVPTTCQALPQRLGPTKDIAAGDVGALRDALAQSRRGTTIYLAAGTYDISDAPIEITTDNITIRSASGDRESVVLDANLGDGGIHIRASQVTIADLTVSQSSSSSSIVVTGRREANMTGVLLYNIALLDHVRNGLGIGRSELGGGSDDGTLACSRIALPNDPSRPESECPNGVTGSGLRGWRFQDNEVLGHHCNGDVARGIALVRGVRDVVLERNILTDNQLGLQLGLSTINTGNIREFRDPLCAAFGHVDFSGAVVRNNVITASSAFDRQDVAIALWNACSTQVVHNTVRYEAGNVGQASIEWRFQTPEVVVQNNLINLGTRSRDGAIVDVEDNTFGSDDALAFAGPFPDFRLAADVDNPLLGAASPLAAGVCDEDFDRQPRGTDREPGADELP